jgi:uncharacterized membrane protein YfcA
MLWWGWSLTDAVPVVLSGTFLAALCSLIVLWRRAYVRYRLALLMAAASIPFALFGHWLIQFIPVRAIEAALCLVLATLGLIGIRRPPARAIARFPQPICVNPSTGRLDWNVPAVIAASGIGGAGGLSAGLFGLGGSFVIAPFLRALSEFDARSVVATTLMTVALISGGALAMIGLTTEGLSGYNIVSYASGAVLGAFMGSRASVLLPALVIDSLLPALLLCLALMIAVRVYGGE